MIPLPRSVTLGDGQVDMELGAPPKLTRRTDTNLPAEGYTLEITKDGEVTIAGGSEAGIFYGEQTLRQLFPAESLRQAAPPGPWPVPVLRISDEPQFRWRGVMLDVARHFMPLADVLRFIDVAAFHKLNTLHLHLTDDQGWRLEVPGWPRLTTVGSWRKRTQMGASKPERYEDRPHGGFYSTDDLKEVVAFAAKRHITIVPEIDMPGHMEAAIAAYPSLGNGLDGVKPQVREEWGISTQVLSMADETLDFCRTVLDAVCAIFPSEIIGIGGDECPHDEWKASPDVQRRMKELGLKDESALHGWFVGQMADHLRKQNPPRRPYGWDEILVAGAALPKDTIVGAWRGAEPTAIAAKKGFDVVACPDVSCYLDYRQSEHPDEPTPVGTILTIKDVYSFDPIPSSLSTSDGSRAHILGPQCNIWTEHMESARRVEYMAYPRLCALAEVAWGKQSGGKPAEGAAGFEDFEKRLVGGHLARLSALGVNYRPMSGPRPWDARSDAPGKPRTMEQRLKKNEALIADIR